MTIIKWILAVIFAIFALLQLPDNIVGFILLAIACALVLPVLDALIANSVAFLKSNPLRIFLAVVLAVSALALAGSSTVAFTDVAICSSEGGAACSADKPFFLEGNTPVTITATAREEIAENIQSMTVDISYEPAPDIEVESVYSQSLDATISGESVTVTIVDLPLMVGSYNIEIVPETGEEDATAAIKKATFTVWPTQAEVDRRLATEVDSNDFEDVIDEHFVCIYEGPPVPQGDELVTTEAPADELYYCDETEALPVGTTPIVFDYGFADSLPAGASMENTLLYLPEGEDPFEVYSEATNLEEGLDRFGSLDELTPDVPAGTYAMISIMNAPEAKPVRLEFQVVE